MFWGKNTFDIKPVSLLACKVIGKKIFPAIFFLTVSHMEAHSERGWPNSINVTEKP